MQGRRGQDNYFVNIQGPSQPADSCLQSQTSRSWAGIATNFETHYVPHGELQFNLSYSVTLFQTTATKQPLRVQTKKTVLFSWMYIATLT